MTSHKIKYFVTRVEKYLTENTPPSGDQCGQGGVGVCRDGVELHLQWQSEADFEAGTAGQGMLRLVVDDPDALFEEYKDKGVFHDRTSLKDTSWGTREFAFFDLNGNGLTFYRDL
jgi:hypothetical protein